MSFLKFYIFREIFESFQQQPHYSKLNYGPKKQYLPYVSHPDDEELKSLHLQYRQGDQTSFRKLFDLVGPRVVYLLYRKFFDDSRIQLQDIEDEVQRALIHTLNKDRDFESLFGFVYASAKNKLFSRIEQLDIQKGYYVPQDVLDTVKQKEADDPGTKLRQLVDDLPLGNNLYERSKRVLMLAANGKSSYEIADMLNIDKATVNRDLRSILADIRSRAGVSQQTFHRYSVPMGKRQFNRGRAPRNVKSS